MLFDLLQFASSAFHFPFQVPQKTGDHRYNASSEQVNTDKETDRPLTPLNLGLFVCFLLGDISASIVF